MAAYPDVPTWLRITNGHTGRESEAQSDDSYYREHASELRQEMVEVAALEDSGEIVMDRVMRQHNAYRRKKRSSSREE